MNSKEQARGDASRPGPGFHVMAKPIGPKCNLACAYCFYLEKENLFSGDENYRMTDAVLESFVRQYIESQHTPEVTFAWQGGEPTLMGLDFFRRVVELQARYANGKAIQNSFQTNATLLDDAWCAFFTEHHFLIGVSLDGPRELHDRYRRDKGGQPTFDRVMRGLEFLKKHQTEFNTLTVVNRANSRHPLEVYRFLKEAGSRFLQFIPLVERRADGAARTQGLDLAVPPDSSDEAPATACTPESVEAVTYGTFLIRIFDEWVRKDVGQTFVQIFDVALGNWMGLGPGLCVFAEQCGTALALEHNGDLYACDHYVYPRYRRGNILQERLTDLAVTPDQRRFGRDKVDSLPSACRNCDVVFACHGGCLKQRFIRVAGDPGRLNYLCAGYRQFFRHVDPYMKRMAELLRAGYPAAAIMSELPRGGRNAGKGR